MSTFMCNGTQIDQAQSCKGVIVDFDWNKAVEVIATTTPPTLMALAAWRAATKNRNITRATQIGQHTIGRRVDEVKDTVVQVHGMINGQREKLVDELKIVREEVNNLKEQIGGLKQEVLQLKHKGDKP